MPQMTKESVSQTAVDFLRKEKNTEKIEVSIVEEQNNGWTVRGTCPIDLEGHPWVEKFVVVVDLKGKIQRNKLRITVSTS